ncbi:hypothetical protein P12x_003693 [Tundrisphaera lichenicola]|uniref:hypothetical protein n=1 Tax=Tundrisphaera lichenicola TaxID=2029860 RepID=UPI003EBC690A
MEDDQIDGGMIEIGDPTEEPLVVEPPVRVVIQYRSRGVPWMLIPPMIALSAVGSLMLYHKLAPPRTPQRNSALEGPIAVVPLVDLSPAPSKDIEPAVEAPAVAATSEPAPVEPAAAVTEPAPAEVAPPEIFPEEVPPPTEPVAAPSIDERGVGFDPQALEALDRVPDPPVDESLNPTGGPPAPLEEPRPEVEPALPEEVDPSILPVDPKEARRLRQQRVAEVKRKAEADRGRFHAELRAICRKSRERAGPEIDALCKKYGMEVDPALLSEATRLLKGPAAGATRAVRINLLRSLGFSEPVILHDLIDIQGRFESRATRGGPRTPEEVMVRAAILLLGYPPNRVASPSRSVSAIRPLR